MDTCTHPEYLMKIKLRWLCHPSSSRGDVVKFLVLHRESNNLELEESTGILALHLSC